MRMCNRTSKDQEHIISSKIRFILSFYGLQNWSNFDPKSCLSSQGNTMSQIVQYEIEHNIWQTIEERGKSNVSFILNLIKSAKMPRDNQVMNLNLTLKVKMPCLDKLKQASRGNKQIWYSFRQNCRLNVQCNNLILYKQNWITKHLPTKNWIVISSFSSYVSPPIQNLHHPTDLWSFRHPLKLNFNIGYPNTRTQTVSCISLAAHAQYIYNNRDSKFQFPVHSS